MARLTNRKEHITCSNYAKDVTQSFSFLYFKEGETIGRRFLDTTFLVFVVNGKIEVKSADGKPVKIGTGQFFLLPGGKQIQTYAEEDTCFLLCPFSTNLNLCSRFSLQQLSVSLPLRASSDFFPLALDNRLSKFLSLLVDCLKDGLGCIHYHQIKREELFLYLRAGYEKDTLARFFYPILGRDMEFKLFVETYSQRVFNVKDLAVRANMSLSTFNRRFKETFHDTAKNWLMLRKLEQLKNDIVMGNASFASIADKYHFSSISYLITFCKKHFGKTPSELRKDVAFKSK